MIQQVFWFFVLLSGQRSSGSCSVAHTAQDRVKVAANEGRGERKEK